MIGGLILISHRWRSNRSKVQIESLGKLMNLRRSLQTTFAISRERRGLKIRHQRNRSLIRRRKSEIRRNRRNWRKKRKKLRER